MTTLTLDTSVDTSSIKNFFSSTFGVSNYFPLSKKSEIIDVVVINNIQSQYKFDLCESQLTEQAKKFSLSSFSKEWDEEDDDFWSKF
jgi:hypothetical protein